MAEWSNWWNSLSNLNQWFYNGAAFFSVLFLWQMIGAFLGLIDVQDADVSHPDGSGFGHGDAGAGHAGATHGDHGDSSHTQAHSGHEPVVDFKLLTVRSILAFFTLFFWAGGLYLTNGTETFWSLCYAVLWGSVAMVSVAMCLYLLQRMVESGTPDIATCVGTRGVVYMDIPEAGQGEARVLVSGAVSCIKARSAHGQPIKAGTPVRVTRALGSTTVEVEPAAETTTNT
jgi:membrane protein implicated in regulation of membrane protease activity